MPKRLELTDVHDALRDKIVALVDRHGPALDTMAKVSAVLSAAVRVASRTGRVGTLSKALRIALEAMEEMETQRRDH